VSEDRLRPHHGDQELLTVDDVAQWLNVPKRWVYDRAQRGELPSGRVGKYLRFRRPDVAAFITRTFEQE
jgi:PTS system nitrogen regulatory IIA component